MIEEERPVAVVFWSPMVEKAIAAMPMIEATIESYNKQVKLWKMDTYRNQRVAKRYGVTENPTIVIMHKGEPVATLVDTEVTEDNIRQALMNVVK